MFKGKEFITNSINNWSLSDVPIACSLSGGLDSSLIASIFASNSSKRIKTITVGYEGVNHLHDERDYANKMSKYIDSEHLEVIINPNDILKDLVKFSKICVSLMLKFSILACL